MSDMGDKDRSRERARRDRPTRFSEASRDRSMDRGRDRGSMKSSNNRVYVSNIPYEYRWQDMKDLFRNQVGDVQFVELFVDDNDKPKGCGIVEFADSSSVKKCIEVMQRYEVKGRKLVIKEDSGNMRDKHGSIIGSGNKRSRGGDDRFGRDDRDRYDRGGGGGGGGMQMTSDKWGNTYGLSPQFLESLNIDAPLGNRVFVANLEYNIDKKKLKEVFRLAGRVIRVEIPTDKDGRSRGFAVIEFDHPVEAVQAISMFHNQVLFERAMTVRMDRANENFKLPEGLKSIGMGLGSNGEPLKNVSHNLPSLSSSQANTGAGLLGAVPSQALQVANALSGLSSSALSSLANPLQAANLSSLASNLLGNGLGGADLSLASSLVTNPLVQNQSQIAPFTGSSAANANPQSLTGNTGNSVQSFSRPDSFSNQNAGFGQNQSFSSGGGGRGFQSFDAPKASSGSNFGGGFNSSDRGGGGYGMNSSNDNKSGGYSRKVLVSNLPPTASYKMLHEKFSEFGDVQHFEEKGNGSILVVYNADWQAERAIKNLDRARIDGRLIEARNYF